MVISLNLVGAPFCAYNETLRASAANMIAVFRSIIFIGDAPREDPPCSKSARSAQALKIVIFRRSSAPANNGCSKPRLNARNADSPAAVRYFDPTQHRGDLACGVWVSLWI